MNDEEIIQKYHQEERNRETIEKFFMALNENDWDTIRSTYEVTENQVFTKESKTRFFEMLNLNDKKWLEHRITANKVYEKFTEFTKSAKKEIENDTKVLTIESAESNVEQGWKHINLTIDDLMKTVVLFNEFSSTKILNIQADRDIITCLVVISELDPKTKIEIAYECNYYFYLRDGKILYSVNIPHLISGLIQLGKVYAESQEETAKEYINSLRTVGIIE
ncbi:MAG: hypothetical protein ACW99Q_22585 [Candidatus Kariarchaeaceae archaeon]|jgi:hypothetical protein